MIFMHEMRFNQVTLANLHLWQHYHQLETLSSSRDCKSEISIVLSLITANSLWQFPSPNLSYSVLYVLEKIIINYANNFSLTVSIS